MQTENQTQIQGGLETFVEPAKEEKKFAVLYNLVEQTYNIHYDMYTCNEVNHNKVDRGIFGNKEALTREMQRLAQDWIEHGYTVGKRDEEFDSPAQLTNRTGSHEVAYIVGKNNVPLEALVKKDNKLYFEHYDCQYHKQLTEVII